MPEMSAKRSEPLIRMLDYTQKWTASVDWRELDACNAFMDPDVADEEGRRLRMPGNVSA